MNKALKLLKSNAVLLIAAAAFGISCFFAPLKEGFLADVDYRTLSTLFCMLACICALRNISFFRTLAKKLAARFRDTRSMVRVLVFVTFFSSMLIGNDMALLTFLPLASVILLGAGKGKLLAFTFIAQNNAANLGGMLTPFGNPQNLYLYGYFDIPTGEFFKIMAIPFAVSAVLIWVSTCFVKREGLPSRARAAGSNPYAPYSTACSFS